MAFRALSLEKRGAIAYISLQRPDQGNAIDEVLLGELAQACENIETDGEIRAVVLSGGPGPVFCQGWDWPWLAAASGQGTDEAKEGLSDAFSCLAQLPRPVVCAINGDAFSAGMELALACDIRIAAEGSRFGLPETAMGLIPMGGGTQRLPRLVGWGWATQLILTAEPIGDQEALRAGLVSAVFPGERVLGEAEAIAQRIAQRGPLAVRYAKEAVARGLEMTLEQALRYETDLTIILQTTEDRAEGVRAFLEKRKPRFKGK